MRRRSLIILAGSFALLGRHWATSRSLSTDTAMQRIAQAAQFDLDSSTLNALHELGKNAADFSSKNLSEAIATDFRTGCTVILGGVLLSHHEVAEALKRSKSFTEIRYT